MMIFLTVVASLILCTLGAIAYFGYRALNDARNFIGGLYEAYSALTKADESGASKLNQYVSQLSQTFARDILTEAKQSLRGTQSGMVRSANAEIAGESLPLMAGNNLWLNVLLAMLPKKYKNMMGGAVASKIIGGNIVSNDNGHGAVESAPKFKL